MSQNIEDDRKKWPGGPSSFDAASKQKPNHIWQNPSDYDAEYPYNQVYTTRAGHSVEFDNTPGKERIRIIHKDGSFVEMQHDGTWVHRTQGTSQEVVVKDKNVKVKGSEHVHIEGDAEWKVDGDVDWEIGGDLHLKVHGNIIVNTPLFHVVGEAMSHNDKDIGSTHRHRDVMPGGSLSGVPNQGKSAE
jgi:hypothetical protein